MTTAESQWSVSGLCIIARPGELASVEEMLNARQGLEVHARDPESSKLIAVQECATIEDHQNRLREVQALPGVMTADLVLHYADPDAGFDSTPPGGEE